MKMMKPYRVIMADPPWSFRNRKTGGSMRSGAEAQYPVMSVSDICSLKVKSVADDDSFLFLWWVASMPGEALRVVSSWGYKLVTMTAFSWIKQTVNGNDHFGLGFYTRQQQEHCLLAKRGTPKVVSKSVRQNVRASVRGHSRKPDEVREQIVALCGDVPRLEMFARPPVPAGWDAWGLDVENAIDIPVGPGAMRRIREKHKGQVRRAGLSKLGYDDTV